MSCILRRAAFEADLLAYGRQRPLNCWRGGGMGVVRSAAVGGGCGGGRGGDGGVRWCS